MDLFMFLGVTLNLGILAVMYTILGALYSYVFYHIFDEFDEKWEKRSDLFKFSDVCLELFLVSVCAFWTSQTVKTVTPFFPIGHKYDRIVDDYISGIFFIFAIFIFLDDLSEKLKSLYEIHLGKHFEKLFPQHGSIIDFSLSYTPNSKTDKRIPL